MEPLPKLPELTVADIVSHLNSYVEQPVNVPYFSDKGKELDQLYTDLVKSTLNEIKCCGEKFKSYDELKRHVMKHQIVLDEYNISDSVDKKEKTLNNIFDKLINSNENVDVNVNTVLKAREEANKTDLESTLNQYLGGKSRKHKTRKSKSRKSKTRKHKSRKHKSRNSKSRKH